VEGDDSPEAVLHFWFGAPPLQQRAEWFRKSDGFDALIRQCFAPLVEAELDGDLPAAWSDGPGEWLARILVLDQFTRNIFRGSARAFAGDDRALALALAMIEDGSHLSLAPLQRWFAYLPFEHAEDLAMQERSVALFGALAAEDTMLAGALDYAQRHQEVIRRFGRFPHRNALLGRASTADELLYLQRPGAGF
jgi:uncharacterized protein (DUF924 family)